jgi:hypothetical protein
MSDAGFNATRQNERVQEKEALYRLAPITSRLN